MFGKNSIISCLDGFRGFEVVKLCDYSILEGMFCWFVNFKEIDFVREEIG